jgi:CHASE3 domain sensor protein
VRRLRVQLTVLLALLGLLVLAWGAAVFLGARDAARTSASLQSTVDRVDELRRAATRLSRDLVTMETSRRAYLVTGDEAARRAHLRAGARADRGVRRVRRLSRPWVDLSPLADRVARRYQAWVRSGRDELAARRDGARAAAAVATGGAADRRFQALWSGQTALEDRLARSQRVVVGGQDRTYRTAQALAVRTALMMLAALVLIAVWLRRAVGARPTPCARPRAVWPVVISKPR